MDSTTDTAKVEDEAVVLLYCQQDDRDQVLHQILASRYSMQDRY